MCSTAQIRSIQFQTGSATEGPMRLLGDDRLFTSQVPAFSLPHQPRGSLDPPCRACFRPLPRRHAHPSRVVVSIVGQTSDHFLLMRS